ncbi:hypothetical protein ACJX0J_018392, partial [Zea mays]
NMPLGGLHCYLAQREHRSRKIFYKYSTHKFFLNSSKILAIAQNCLSHNLDLEKGVSFFKIKRGLIVWAIT